MAAFSDCVRRQGVDPTPLKPDLEQRQSDPEGFRRGIQARIKCIPQLPPPLRAQAEELEQQYGGMF